MNDRPFKRRYAPPGAAPRIANWRSWPVLLLSIGCAGCVTEDLRIAPLSTREAAPGSSLPVRAAEAASPSGSSARQPVSVREALPQALVSSLMIQKRDPALGPGPAGVAATRDDHVATVATPADRSIPPVSSPPVVPPAPLEYPIDLTTALRLAEVENPEIAETRQRIREALGFLQGAQVLALPTLNAGMNYHGHTGNLQRSSGKILAVDQQALYFGGGARTVAAECIGIPAVNIVSPLADVIFEPLAAHQNVDRSRFDAQATVNTVLLDVATLHFDLIAAEASLELFRQTEAEATELARLTRAYADTGQGTKADADRAATTLLLFHRRIQAGEEEVAVASTRLARRLHLDPVVRIHPLLPRIEPITLIDVASPVQDLVRVALQNRPEMGGRSAAVGIATTRYRQERLRPLLPILWLGFSGGAFGGGSNLVQPLLGNFGGRTDLDIRAYWSLQNMGFGNLALWNQRRAQIGVALGDQALAINQIRREVAAALAAATAFRGQIDVTARQLATAQDGFREDLERIRGTIARPIEVENSLDLLAEARQNHLRAIIDYNLAQFRLFVALGSPPPLERPEFGPLPPAPIAAPPLPLSPVTSAPPATVPPALAAAPRTPPR
jgi:outer membrane protein TolC